MSETNVSTNISVFDELQGHFNGALIGQGAPEGVRDGIPTVWARKEQVTDVLRYLKSEVSQPYRTLYDLTVIDERARVNRFPAQPPGDFSIVYTLLSYERKAEVRIKVALEGDAPALASMVELWPAANWYEREAWDMFGIRFDGHPNLRRILMPPTWEGHPLRKDHPARATELGDYLLKQNQAMQESKTLQFRPEEWGLQQAEELDYLFLNLGPQHPGTHGPFRIVLALDGEEIVDAVPEIGFHHRGKEKMGERQSWHTYIPYTDRVDYLSGVMNELPYVLTVEQLAGIHVPDRAKVIRILMSELFRLSNHLVFYGTYAQDLGAMSPVFYMFTDRERVLSVIEAVTGARMHPSWFRIGGVSQDLPEGWQPLFNDLLDYLPGRLAEYDRLVLNNPIFRQRTLNVGEMKPEQAIEWGVTGPFLRSTGFAWDWRKARPYAGYDQFEFDVPVGKQGDCYDRAGVHVEEMRQSMRIIRQCIDNMPPGPYKSDHPLATPPLKQNTMHDIETLIDHFLNVSWGPIIPAGEAMTTVELTKGSYSYYLISDGGPISYRTRIRTASFPHLQTLPMLSRGMMIPDLLAILGSIDFVLADVDR